MDALIILFTTALVALFAGFAKKPKLVLSITVLGCIGTVISLMNGIYNHTWLIHLISYKGLDFQNEKTLLFCIALVVMTLLVALMSYDRFKEQANHTGDYLALMLFSACGALMMVSCTDLFMFFLALEILSIPVYVLVGSNKSDVRSTESSLKYFLMGAFATGIFLFGIAWVYGATRSFDLAEIGMAAQTMTEKGGTSGMLYLGAFFIIAAFLFKIGAAPFHFWGPDVYDGAPNPVMAYMSSTVKLAGFYGFFKLLNLLILDSSIFVKLMPLFAGMAVLSMFVGNLSALKQSKLRRLLAFSSIVHMGYMLMVCVVKLDNVENIILFYFCSYAASVIGLVTVASVINDKEDRIESMNGLSKRNPFLAFVAVLSILSMAGIPPTAGFFAKYMLFVDAWDKASWLVIIALLNSAIGVYYYLRLIIAILTKNEQSQMKLKLSVPSTIAMCACVLVILCLSFYASYLFGNIWK